MQEIWVPSLGQEDPLEKGMAHSVLLPLIWTEELGGVIAHGVRTEAT